MPHRGPGRGASFGVIEEPSRADRSPDRLMLVLIATDLDGTLLTGDKQLSSRTRRMLAAAARAGVPVVPVTARQIYGLSGWRDVLTSWALCSNGAICWNLADETILFRQLMDAQMCQRFTQDLLKVAPGTVFATIRDDGEEFVSQTGYAELADVADHNRDPRTMPSLPLEDVVAQDCLKLVARHPSMPVDELARLAVSVGGDQVHVTTSGVPMLEISPAGVTKDSGLALLCEHLGVDRADVVAFGDGANDVEMLTWAGTSWAVGNAVAQAKAAADHVAESNDDDGVAQIVEGLLERL